MKVALTILLRKYSFELPGGPGTSFGTKMNIVTRPMIQGEMDCKLPMRIRKVEV
jgi:hypothetical protein